MRVCGNCRKDDRPILTWDKECECGVEPDPTKHAANCKALMHSVIIHLVRIPKTDLTTGGDLSTYHKAQGWILRRDGERYYKGKMLCYDCIELQHATEQRQAEYKKACREALGLSDQTYAQMLAQST